ncbi:MAG: hypothetical protein VW378_00520 [bacterium]
MKLNPMSLGMAGGVLYGVFIFIITLLGVISGYGLAYINILAGLFPVYSVSFVGAILGLVYGFILGFVLFYFLGYLYNHFDT